MARSRRRRRPNNDTDVGAWLLGGLAAAVVGGAILQAVHDHPVITTLILVLIIAAGALGLRLWLARRRHLAERERCIAVTDGMSGPQFEQYVARLMRASGLRRVQVCGGAGDMGADIVAYTPDRRRVVVQCKRYQGKLSSPEVQRFAGTVRDIHGADIAVLVTTGWPSAPAREVARRCRITLVDRDALTTWITTGAAPIAGCATRVPAPQRRTPPVTQPTSGTVTSPREDWWSTP